jgi:hypothetical protein
MPVIVLAVIAVAGAALHIRRHPDRDRPAYAVDTVLVWWLVVVVGLWGFIGALYHLVDGPGVAADIGYTRGDGGFQFENAIGDLAIAVAALLCARFRRGFWLATVIVFAVQYYGDAGGHIYFWLAEDNTKPDNVGIPLWFDLIAPTVAIALYTLSWRHGGDARPLETHERAVFV